MKPSENPEIARESPVRRPRSAWVRLLVMGVLASVGLGLVVLLSRNAPARPMKAFDARPLVALRRQQPHFVLLGNSMVPTRFDAKLLNRLLVPRRATIIAKGGSKSAAWYLYFKNYLQASGVRPERVILFFRNYELTEPRARATGPELLRLELVSRGEEPLVERKLRPSLRAEPIAHFEWWLDRIAPASRLDVADLSESLGLSLARKFGAVEDDASIKSTVNSLFSLSALRDAPAPPEPDVDEEVQDFSDVVDASFLPDIIQIAKQAKLPLMLVHVRRRSAADGIPDPPAFKSYLRDLEGYVKKEGVEFIDMSGATWETPDLYGNGDHIAARHRASYTRLFVERMPQVFR